MTPLSQSPVALVISLTRPYLCSLFLIRYLFILITLQFPRFSWFVAKTLMENTPGKEKRGEAEEGGVEFGSNVGGALDGRNEGREGGDVRRRGPQGFERKSRHVMGFFF